MSTDRPRHGPLIATIGAAVLAVSVFLPWYSFTLTAQGATEAQQTLNSVAAQLGNSTFQSQAKTVGSAFGTLAGQQIGTVSAHDVFKDFYIVLLALAGVAFFAAVTRLASGAHGGWANGGSIAVVGVVAALYVAFRMFERPSPQEAVFVVSLGYGIWLALGGSLAIVAGGMWPSGEGRKADAEHLAKAWEGLSGWTPEA